MFGNRPQNTQQTAVFMKAFQTLFDDLRINPVVPAGTPSKEMTVPIAFGPREKWLTALRADPDKDAPGIIMPRMSFEITSLSYDPDKNLPVGIRNQRIGSKYYFAPAPYRIDLNLSILTKYHEDMFSIVEQILPYFKPKLTVKVKTMGDSEKTHSMDVTLTGVSPETEYEGSMDERRVLIYTLSFSISANFYISNTAAGNLIKHATVNFKDMEGNPTENIKVYPGLTPDGEPTNDPAETIAWQDIKQTDDHAIIVEVEDIRNV